jgi:hypothetical protein
MSSRFGGDVKSSVTIDVTTPASDDVQFMKGTEQ